MNKKYKTKKSILGVKKTQEFKHKILKPILKGAYQTTIILASSIAATSLFVNGASFIYAKNNDMLNFKEVSYSQNVSVEEGYYNKRPVIVCISSEFSELAQQSIISGIKYLDECATGLKFAYYIGDPTSDPSNIAIHKKDFNNKIRVGEATLGELDSQQIKGVVHLEEKIDTILIMKNTTVHELCHVLGLEHSKSLNSMMFPIISTSKLSKEDINNINTLYPG